MLICCDSLINFSSVIPVRSITWCHVGLFFLNFDSGTDSIGIRLQLYETDNHIWNLSSVTEQVPWWRFLYRRFIESAGDQQLWRKWDWAEGIVELQCSYYKGLSRPSTGLSWDRLAELFCISSSVILFGCHLLPRRRLGQRHLSTKRARIVGNWKQNYKADFIFSSEEVITKKPSPGEKVAAKLTDEGKKLRA